MANKSSKSFSGEDRSQPVHLRQNQVEKEDVRENSDPVTPQGSREGEQDNLSGRGYDEDQPGQPVRSSGSIKQDHQQAPAGEPDENEQKENIKH